MKFRFLPLMFLTFAFDTSRNLAIANDPAPQAGQCVDGAIAPDVVMGMIHRESARQGVEARLALAIAQNESGYGRFVNSPAGARGPMQLIPETALRFGVKNICDPEENIRGGVAYLKTLNDMFGGNIMLVIAAYNAGEARVLRSGGIPAIAETVNYTARVTNAYFGFKNILQKQNSRQDSAKFKAHTSELPDEIDVMTTGAIAPEKATLIPDTKDQPVRKWIGGSVLYVH